MKIYRDGAVAAVLIGAWVAQLAFGQAAPEDLRPSPEAVHEAVTTRIDVDGSLGWSDRFRRPPFMAVGPQATPAGENTRTLGLKAMRITGLWQSADLGALTLVMRPDALTPRSERSTSKVFEARELDGRSGAPYRPTPRLQLLDSYVFAVAPRANFSPSIGVFEDFAAGLAAFSSILPFGLAVQLPAKFGAADLKWRYLASSSPLPRARSQVTTDVFVYQGSDDRGEAVGRTARDFDTGTISADPYAGGAVSIGFFQSHGLSLMLLAGGHDTATANGRIAETYVQAGSAVDVPIGVRSLRLAMDVRSSRERWRGASGTAPRTQSSLSVTNSLPVFERGYFLVGAHVGTSDDVPARWGAAEDERVLVEGRQLELGYLVDLGGGLTTTLAVCEEHRRAKLPDGERVGAFANHEGERRAVLRRAGLELRYRLTGTRGGL